MSRDYLERKEIGDYRISIYPDYDAECPVTNWDMGACYIFEHLERGRYELCPDCDWKEWVSNIREESVESILQRIAAEVVTQEDIIKYYKAGKVKGVRFIYFFNFSVYDCKGLFLPRFVFLRIEATELVKTFLSCISYSSLERSCLTIIYKLTKVKVSKAYTFGHRNLLFVNRACSCHVLYF